MSTHPSEKPDPVAANLDVLTAMPGSLDDGGTRSEAVSATLRVILQAVESTVGGVVIGDLSACIIYVNPAFLRMFGYTSREEVLGRETRVLFDSEDVARLSDVKAMVDMKHGATVELDVRRKDGTTFPVEVACTEIVDRDGRVAGRMASFVDISARKEAEHQREELIAQLRQALATIKTLRGLLPICASCKRIRDDDGYWQQLEAYISDHSEATFSHGICPECVKKLYAEFAE